MTSKKFNPLKLFSSASINNRPSQFLWWVKIQTTNPQCIYYFGPFINATDAYLHQAGYIKDLLAEGAEITDIRLLQQYQPEKLTIDSETVKEG